MGGTYSSETYFTVDKDSSGYRYTAKFDEDKLGEGACRIAYRGRVISSSPTGGSQVGYQCVVKVFKEEFARNYDQWVPDLVAHKRAVKMANSFSRLFPNAVEVLTPLIARVETRGGFYLLWTWNVAPVGNVRDHEYVSMEPYLPGRWEKFNSNGGWCKEGSEILQTFSHWSACKSGYQFLLCDLQGVVRDGKYIITDPCIHSVDQIHGPTDLGVAGMELFLKGHRCNRMCQQLGLWRNPVPYNPSNKVGSTYSFQLTEDQVMMNKQKKGRYINPMSCVPEIAF